jgi:outer membrane protein
MKTLLTSAALALSLLSTTAMAQAIEPAKIMVVDFERLIFDSAAGKAAYAKLQADQAVLTTRRNSIGEDVKRREDALTKLRDAVEKGVTPRETFEEQVKSYQRIVQQYDQEMQTKSAELQRADAFVKQQILAGADSVVKGLQGERGANLVVARNSVVLVSAGLDLTDVVIQRVNTKLPSVSTTPPPQAKAATPAPAPATPPKK